jgi:DNA-directed RNA polymerase subunit RPC12/RpoP
MARCPECGRRIKYLICLELEDVLTVALYHGYDTYTNRQEKLRLTKGKVYKCPKCNNIITDDEKIAKFIMEAEEQ